MTTFWLCWEVGEGPSSPHMDSLEFMQGFLAFEANSLGSDLGPEQAHNRKEVHERDPDSLLHQGYCLRDWASLSYPPSTRPPSAQFLGLVVGLLWKATGGPALGSSAIVAVETGLDGD